MIRPLFECDREESRLDFLRSLPRIVPKPTPGPNGLSGMLLDIPFTIVELAYLTHNFYRYYGKYPSILGGYLIERYAEAGPVFDNYVGSGTTLVEARIRGVDSSGVDINPLSVLASNVKTRAHRDLRGLREFRDTTLRLATEGKSRILPLPAPDRIHKWFSENNLDRLQRLRDALLSQAASPLREFALVAFLAIIRRCSNAYDGEVRPHIKRNKKPRDPFEAFADKFDDMLKHEGEFLEVVPENGSAQAFCASCTDEDLGRYMPYGRPQLVISHPPYLNCFNYYAVFSLENMWSYEFEDVWEGLSEEWVKMNEHICWPATKADVIDRYFINLKSAYSNLRRFVEPGSKLAIVIGDSTLRNQLIPVHEKVIDMLPECGYRPVEVLYRTTHYGIGKYAYHTRADYHGEALKKDGVIVAEAFD